MANIKTIFIEDQGRSVPYLSEEDLAVGDLVKAPDPLAKGWHFYFVVTSISGDRATAKYHALH